MHEVAFADTLRTGYTQAMGLFSSKKDDNRLAASLEKGTRRLTDVEGALVLLESKFRNLELEWTNAHEKLKSISGRIAKRQALDDPEPPEVVAAVQDEQAPPDPYAHLDPVSARIQRRRNSGRI